MPRGFGRLPFLMGRRVRRDDSPSDEPAVVAAPIEPDMAPVGPPALLPALIVRQVLVDSTEITPVWARSRPAAAPEPADPAESALSVSEPPAPKPTRRRRTSATSGEQKPAATPRRTRKPNGSRRESQ